MRIRSLDERRVAEAKMLCEAKAAAVFFWSASGNK